MPTRYRLRAAAAEDFVPSPRETPPARRGDFSPPAVEDFRPPGPKYPFAVDAHRGRRHRRAPLVAAALALAMIGGGSASANHSVSGTIVLPCIHPTLRKIGVMQCGWRFTLPTHGDLTGYRVHTGVPADADIYFYDAADNFISANTGPYPIQADPPWIADQCVDLTGDVPAAAVRAIVVVTPSACGGVDGQTGVNATYTTTA
jgi:hypothetical protein